ncbi:hypothetical protein PR048_001668 [Dryococelus australis]|uniref:DDE Tnp4 domain-containing protein n=1 Tax=Dryococelus australis TaxID=614101 RepID=A0ABQ9II62_9NEOP|nr:hypothetical protein PR048_001668 [Dryococelus australis]
MPRSTIFGMCTAVLILIVAMLLSVVHHPPKAELNISMEFAALAGSNVFRQCVRAIDGCHIRVQCPPALYDQYINRKLLAARRCIFTKALDVKLTKAAEGIAACTIMHNICITQGDIFPPDANEPWQHLRNTNDDRDAHHHRELMLS